MKVLISACLLGLCCRYDGRSRECPDAVRLLDRHELIPVCPEQMGGLPTPRPPAEIVGDRVVNCEGADVTEEYLRGAEEAWRLCEMTGCRLAVLKANSPSCGRDQVYDGSFTGTLVPGQGVAARYLAERGVRVLTEEDLRYADGVHAL